MLKALHMALAFLTVTGFVIRVGWAYVSPDLLQARWVRVAPHIVDSLLLILGVLLALNLAGGFWQDWLIAKMLGLLSYIGFGVLALRGQGILRHVGLAGALVSAGYIFAVAFTRSPWPPG
ncbi:MAG: SirB2 family protein [Pseudomonadota bacterium]